MTIKIADSAILSWGREILIEESEALKDASQNLDEAFVKTVEAILKISGKVIVTGIGKSGHVARKVAATLASTGTSSFFMHPAEALHGDFGMMAKSDVLLAIAFGGETREVIEVAKFARRLGIKIISITGNFDSSLTKLSDLILNGSVRKEACPLNLAPTSSSTVALAIGDALAVSLMKARGFREEDFAMFHPEGKLGRRLSLISEHMHAIDRDDTLREGDNFHRVLEFVTRKNFGIAAVVVEDGSLLGAITDGDLRRAMLRSEGKVFSLCAADLMTKSPKTILKGALSLDAFRIMENTNITALFVLETELTRKPVGIVRMHDLLAAKII